jgi:hypothetical protein
LFARVFAKRYHAKVKFLHEAGTEVLADLRSQESIQPPEKEYMLTEPDEVVETDK